jgi:hypothetical protein
MNHLACPTKASALAMASAVLSKDSHESFEAKRIAKQVRATFTFPNGYEMSMTCASDLAAVTLAKAMLANLANPPTSAEYSTFGAFRSFSLIIDGKVVG